MYLTDNQEKDYKRYFKYEGDPGFSPERNKYVIEKTIAKHEKALRDRKKKQRESFEMGADAVSYYLMYLIDRHGTKSPESYFGKRELAKLAGENIKNKLKNRLINQEMNI